MLTGDERSRKTSALRAFEDLGYYIGAKTAST